MTEIDVFLRYMMEEVLEKVVQRFSDPTWVQKTIEIDPGYFETTCDEVMSYYGYFKERMKDLDGGIFMQVIDNHTVRLDFYRITD